jgi:hypothetical protein
MHTYRKIPNLKYICAVCFHERYTSLQTSEWFQLPQSRSFLNQNPTPLASFGRHGKLIFSCKIWSWNVHLVYKKTNVQQKGTLFMNDGPSFFKGGVWKSWATFFFFFFYDSGPCFSIWECRGHTVHMLVDFKRQVAKAKNVNFTWCRAKILRRTQNPSPDCMFLSCPWSFETNMAPHVHRPFWLSRRSCTQCVSFAQLCFKPFICRTSYNVHLLAHIHFHASSIFPNSVLYWVAN